jgi:putative two-component system response regulator
MGTTLAQRIEEFSKRAPDASCEWIAASLEQLSTDLNAELTTPSRHRAVVFGSAQQLIASIRPEAMTAAGAECLVAIAKHHFLNGCAVAGLAPAEQAVAVLKRVGDPVSLRRALTALGVLQNDTGNLPAAIESFADALEYARATGDTCSEASVWNNIGATQIYAGQYSDAIACFETVLKLCDSDARCEPLRAPALGNLALSCLHLEDYAKGLRSAKAAVEAAGEPVTPSDMFARVLTESYYTRLLLAVDARGGARERADVAKRYAAESKLERAELIAGMAEGLCEVYEGKIDLGISRLTKVLEKARVLRGSLRDALIAMVNAHEIAGKPDLALVYLRELMMHTRQFQQENVLLHHRLHLEQLEKKGSAPVVSPDALMARHEVTLRDKLADQVAHYELLHSRIDMLERLAVTAELRDDATGEHSYRVGKLASLLAHEYGRDREFCSMIDLAARLHDIGKIGIPDGILLKNGRLNENEAKLMQAHTAIGSELLAQSNVPHMKMAEEIARFHHEHWDGSGYPFGIGNDAIPLEARITALADVFDALTHRRPYKEQWTVEAALAEIAAHKGRHFDPELTELFLLLIPRLQREHGELDAYLGQSARESRLIQARRKIAETLRQFSSERGEPGGQRGGGQSGQIEAGGQIEPDGQIAPTEHSDPQP